MQTRMTVIKVAIAVTVEPAETLTADRAKTAEWAEMARMAVMVPPDKQTGHQYYE